jgi:hypothetical protein
MPYFGEELSPMKKMVFAAGVLLTLGSAIGASAQMTGGAGSGVGSGPPGDLPNGGLGTMNAPATNQSNTVLPPSAGLPDQSGTGLTAGPSTAMGRSANGAAGAYNKDDLGVSQATAPIARREPGVGFSDRDIGGHGRALDSTVLGTGTGTGDGLITGSGAQIH